MLQSLGNHEFDDGVKGLLPFINNATFPILASNLDLRKEQDLYSPNLKNSVVFDLDGVKVAVIGYVTPETKVREYRVIKKYNTFRRVLIFCDVTLCSLVIAEDSRILFIVTVARISILLYCNYNI